MIKYILLVLDKLLNYFKGINCKFNSCCGSKCSSECSQKKKDDANRKLVMYTNIVILAKMLNGL